jgi:SAM-dependent methyltransferase
VNHRPEYDRYRDFSTSRTELADRLASQALATVQPWLTKRIEDLDVLDAGSGYGGTAIALSRLCASVVGCEPASALHEAAQASLAREDHGQVEFVHSGVEELEFDEAFDLVILDNVYEHLPDHDAALAAIGRALRPEGVLYVLVPNKLWPIEAHYDLPFLSWLPVPLADRYLRLTRRGNSYQDASYAPTYWRLKKALKKHGLTYEFVLPADPGATVAGTPWHYRTGMALLRRFPSLWSISKALLVVAVKPRGSSVETE